MTALITCDVDQRQFIGVWFEAGRQHVAAAQADPRRHKLTPYMMPGKSGQYHLIEAGRSQRGQVVRFCWSVHKNAAGYFLGWREVRLLDGQVRRYDWVARKVRRRAQELAERRAIAFRGRQRVERERLLMEPYLRRGFICNNPYRYIDVPVAAGVVL
jgi:hypothetical protein